MGSKTKQVGGSPSGAALSDQFTNFLSSFLGNGGGGSYGWGQSGRIGAGVPAGAGAYTGTAGNLGGFMQGIMSGYGIPKANDLNLNVNTSFLDPSKAQADYTNLFNQQSQKDVDAIRARFGASGGMAFGTPGASAEATYRSQQAPRLGLALEDIGQQRLAALQRQQQIQLSQRGQDIQQNLGGVQAQIAALSPMWQSILDVYNKNVPQAQIVQQKSLLGQIASGIGSIAAPVASMFMPGLGGGGGGGGIGSLSSTPIDTTSWMNDPNQIPLAGGFRGPVLPSGATP